MSGSGKIGETETQTTETETETDRVTLVPRMRIDFKVKPFGRGVSYDVHQLVDQIMTEASKLIGGTGGEISIRDVHIKPSLSPSPSPCCYEPSSTRADYERQLKFGDRGCLFIRDLTFVDRFEGDDWDDKFYNARLFLLQGLHCSLVVSASSPQIISTFLKPSEDFYATQLLIDSAALPTVELKGLPSEWLTDSRSLRKCLQNLADFKIFDTNKDAVLIQFGDYEEFCKALRQLCLSSLKKDGKIVDYELTLTNSLVSYTRPQQTIYNSYSE